ncbi:hypothetical protein V8E55_003199 [Tylopilus felleus]
MPDLSESNGMVFVEFHVGAGDKSCEKDSTVAFCMEATITHNTGVVELLKITHNGRTDSVCISQSHYSVYLDHNSTPVLPSILKPEALCPCPPDMPHPRPVTNLSLLAKVLDNKVVIELPLKHQEIYQFTHTPDMPGPLVIEIRPSPTFTSNEWFKPDEAHKQLPLLLRKDTMDVVLVESSETESEDEVENHKRVQQANITCMPKPRPSHVMEDIPVPRMSRWLRHCNQVHGALVKSSASKVDAVQHLLDVLDGGFCPLNTLKIWLFIDYMPSRTRFSMFWTNWNAWAPFKFTYFSQKSSQKWFPRYVQTIAKPVPSKLQPTHHKSRPVPIVR